MEQIAGEVSECPPLEMCQPPVGTALRHVLWGDRGGGTAVLSSHVTHPGGERDTGALREEHRELFGKNRDKAATRQRPQDTAPPPP